MDNETSNNARAFQVRIVKDSGQITMSFYRQLYLALIVIGICCVMGCRSGGTKARPGSFTNAPSDSYRSARPTQGAGLNNCDFICFEDVGWTDIWNYPFTVCLDDPNNELKDCIGKHLKNSAVDEFGPEYTLLKIVKISPGDFREIKVPISDFVSKARGQVRGDGEYGTVGVTISFESKVQSKDIGPDDYKLLLSQIPVDVLQHNPKLAAGLQEMIKGPPLRGKIHKLL